MNKVQAYFAFWSQFGWAVYDETSTPDDAEMPRITLEFGNDDFGHPIALVASLWTRSTSWEAVELKAIQIEQTIAKGGIIVTYNDGGNAFWIERGSPWAQRMADSSDDMVRRIVLNLEVEFLD